MHELTQKLRRKLLRFRASDSINSGFGWMCKHDQRLPVFLVTRTLLIYLRAYVRPWCFTALTCFDRMPFGFYRHIMA